MQPFKEFCYDRHDNYCNQKYGDGLPYSFHLKCVEAQGEKFSHLLPIKWVKNKDNYKAKDVSYKDIVKIALSGHDILEDARMSYNELLEVVNSEKLGNSLAAKEVCDIIYCVTDEKGKNRAERKSEKYYEELKANELAVFVKLCDIAANTLYSKLTGSSMYGKYKKEFGPFKGKVYVERFKELFDYVENL